MARNSKRPKGKKSSKMAIATDIYNRMIKQKGITRKDIIAKFMAEAKLTKAGARTYFQLIKAKKK